MVISFDLKIKKYQSNYIACTANCEIVITESNLQLKRIKRNVTG